MSTIPLYMTDKQPLRCQAVIETVEEEDGLFVVTTDASCVHPQGGGQPCDLGRIEWQGGGMTLQKAYKIDGNITHIGEVDGVLPVPGVACTMDVDAERRLLHSRLHSAGHLLDVAMVHCGYHLPPTKGYHFPDSPYVEYEGVIAPEERASAKDALNTNLGELIAHGHPVAIIWDGNPDHGRRVEIIPGFGCGCGGTHVHNTGEIGTIEVRKIKAKNGHTRISYRIDPMS